MSLAGRVWRAGLAGYTSLRTGSSTGKLVAVGLASLASIRASVLIALRGAGMGGGITAIHTRDRWAELRWAYR